MSQSQSFVLFIWLAMSFSETLTFGTQEAKLSYFSTFIWVVRTIVLADITRPLNYDKITRSCLTAKVLVKTSEWRREYNRYPWLQSDLF